MHLHCLSGGNSRRCRRDGLRAGHRWRRGRDCLRAGHRWGRRSPVLTLPPESVVMYMEPSLPAVEATPLLVAEGALPSVDCVEVEALGGGMSTTSILSKPTYALPTHWILNVAGAESSS
jgi:hypothetical protein